MNRMTVLLPITLGSLLCSLALQAQAPAAAGSAGADTLTITTKDVPVPDAQASGSPEAANTIRIVRLSQTSGKVELDRNIGLDFEGAFNNLPITQGARLKTGEGSAEVEFEDGTTLRLIPDTQVDFTQLSRSAEGATLSGMKVLRGTVYVSLSKTKGNAFDLTSGDGVIKPRPGAHLRLEVKDTESRLSVISGTADFTNTSGSNEVGKMKSLIFNTSTRAPADLIAGIEDVPFDSWDERQAEYHKRYSRGNALAGSGSTYGLADLNYYGSFADVDGCGRIWRPYFASAGWDPYASGIWALYPGSGYSWVSPYPWGWAPFHYGSWLQCGGGWGWQPGGGWYGLTVRDPHWDAGHHHLRGPIHVHPFPPRPHPIQGKANSMIAVNQKPLTFSRVDRATGSFNFRNDSAGLGVPRGEFGKLNKLSETAGKAGSTNIPVFFTPPSRSDFSTAGNHAGSFNRPESQNREAHSTYAQRGGGNPAESNRGSNGVASAYNGVRSSNSGGYSSAPRSGYTGGGSGYSGVSHAGGGGSSGSVAGGSHVSAPAPSAPVSMPSAPAPSAPSAHR
jgi:hypothetical protein